MLNHGIQNHGLSSLLKAALERKKSKNKAFSSRALARDLGISPSFLSMVMSGKKQLSFETALRISGVLELKGRIKSQFLRAAVVENLGENMQAHDIHSLLFAHPVPDTFVPVDQDRFEFFSNWYHVAILDLTNCAGFKADAKWIGKTLGLDRATVYESIERLLRLGLLKKSGNTLVKTNKEISVTPTTTDPTIRKFHSQMIDKAKEALQSAEDADFKRRSISGITMAIDSSRLEEARKRIAQFRKEMYELLASEEAQSDEVYQLNIQLFPLSNTKGGSEE